jgi:hypothetical protein
MVSAGLVVGLNGGPTTTSVAQELAMQSNLVTEPGREHFALVVVTSALNMSPARSTLGTNSRCGPPEACHSGGVACSQLVDDTFPAEVLGEAAGSDHLLVRSGPSAAPAQMA